MVFIFLFRNSTSALERLIEREKLNFKNLNQYEIINVAKHGATISPQEAKNKIAKDAEENRKTLTLTVNKMLTGSTVPQWNTMAFLKDTSSPQEYDQALYRLQSPWIKEVKNIHTGESQVKEDRKPQTLLIDFSLNRMFRIESERTVISNAINSKSGNDEQEEELKRNFKYSPIIYLNSNKLKEVTSTDIIVKIREYSSKRSIVDEAKSLAVDYELLNDAEICSYIEKQPLLGSKSGFSIMPTEENDTDIDAKTNETTSDEEELED